MNICIISRSHYKNNYGFKLRVFRKMQILNFLIQKHKNDMFKIKFYYRS